MSEQKHTPEPWHFDANDRVICQVGIDDLPICTIDGIDEYCHGGWGFGETSEANARRIIACVNACEGLSQDELDGGWTAKGISDYVKKLEAPQVSQQPAQHLDNLAVDRFAAAMKAKMAKQRAKGYAGWDDPVDIGNFAMMLFNREAPTGAPVVPDEKTMPDARLFASVDDFIEQCGFIKGWNACRAAMQANCDAMLKGEK